MSATIAMVISRWRRKRRTGLYTDSAHINSKQHIENESQVLLPPFPPFPSSSSHLPYLPTSLSPPSSHLPYLLPLPAFPPSLPLPTSLPPPSSHLPSLTPSSLFPPPLPPSLLPLPTSPPSLSISLHAITTYCHYCVHIRMFIVGVSACDATPFQAWSGLRLETCHAVHCK